MRTCTKCKTEKDEEDFHWKNKSRNLRHGACSKCCQLAQKKHYVRSPDGVRKRLASNKAGGAERRERNRIFVWEYLLQNPCTKCNESDPILLEFDHREPTEKLHSVSKMIGSEFSIKRIVEEISKCDVLCVSCHRRKTAEQLGWWRFKQG